MSTELKMILNMLEKLDGKVDKIQEVQIEQGQILARNTIIVDKHEERSTKLEDWVAKISAVVVTLESEMKTVLDSQKKVNIHIGKLNVFMRTLEAIPTILKFILLVGGAVSIVYGAFLFFHK